MCNTVYQSAAFDALAYFLRMRNADSRMTKPPEEKLGDACLD